jgi:hypothetical protein
MQRTPDFSPRRAFPTVSRVGLVVAALICTGISVPLASAARLPQKPTTAAPVDPAAISASLKKETGYSASQLTEKPVCAEPRAGTAGCLARLLSVKSTGKPAPLLHLRRTAPTKVMTRSLFRPTITPSDQAASPSPAAGTSAYLQWAYDLTWLSATGGSADTVAIVDAYDDPNAASDLAAFRTENGLPDCDVGTCFNQYDETGLLIHQSGSTGTAPHVDGTGGWEVEESLDLDAVSSLCPNCKIDLIEARSVSFGNLEQAASVANSLGANQISMSFGGDGPANSSNEGTWAFPGVSSLAASGDQSYPGPDVGYPAAYPDVTAIGGTSLQPDATVARGFDESAWSIATCSNGATCGTESGCDSTQPRPTWQSVRTECAGRAYNDISADANPNTGLNIYDTFGGDTGTGCSRWCTVGGTSLATPLTAAYEAVTQVPPAPSPQWTYNDAAQLNDIVSGSDGTCPQGAFVLCNAGSGWDGPTGNGSINGDVMTGPPGIGGDHMSSSNANDVTFAGGVYPNGDDTSYVWQYWQDGNDPSTAASTNGGSVSGTLLQPVSDSVCGTLQPSTLYDYRLVATSSVGTLSYTMNGYSGSFTTAATEGAPSTSTSPTVSGTPAAGQTLFAQPGIWNSQSCNTAPSYQWQASSDGIHFTDITGETNSSYVPDALEAPVGTYFRVAVSESYPATGVAAVGGIEYSAAVGPVAGSQTTTSTATVSTPTSTTPTPPPTTITPPQTTTTAPATTPPTPSSSTTTVHFYRCAHKCTLINTHKATTYTVKPADNGMYIELKVTTTEAGVQPVVTTRWIGPITAPTAGAATIGVAARVASSLAIKGSRNAVLAHVQVAKRTPKRITLAVTPQGKTRTKVWAYVVSNGDVVSCTVSHTLKGKLNLSVALKKGQTVKLVAVRT